MGKKSQMLSFLIYQRVQGQSMFPTHYCWAMAVHPQGQVLQIPKIYIMNVNLLNKVNVYNSVHFKF